MKRLCLVLLAVLMLFSAACTAIDTENSSDSVDSVESVESAEITSSLESSGDDFVEASSAESTETSIEASSEDVSSEEEVSESSAEEISESSENGSASSATSSVDSESSEEGAESDTLSGTIPTRVFESNGVLISGIRGMEKYGGSVESGTNFSKMVGDFKDDFGDDIQVYTIVAPHASCYYAPESYAKLIERGEINFSNLKEKSDPDVHYIDVYNKLWQHIDEDIYPRTEHHWNALAAYYAAEEFAKEAGVNFPSLDNYEKLEMEGFVGSLYNFSGSSVLKKYPETLVAYKPKLSYNASFYYSDNYNLDKPNYRRDSVVFNVRSYPGAFLGGDSISVKIETENTTGRKLVIFKDSYGNCFVPFTVFSFDEVYVLDIRYYKRNGISFCESVGATDVAFVLSGFTATGSVYKNIDKIRKYSN